VTASLLEQLADLPKAEVDALIRAMAPGEASAFEHDWRYRARPETTAARRILAGMAPDGWARLWQDPLRRRMGAGGGQDGASSDRPGGADCGRRAILWLRANPAFCRFRPIRSARFTSPARSGACDRRWRAGRSAGDALGSTDCLAHAWLVRARADRLGLSRTSMVDAAELRTRAALLADAAPIAAI
jgi:hypothetical protein